SHGGISSTSDLSIETERNLGEGRSPSQMAGASSGAGSAARNGGGEARRGGDAAADLGLRVLEGGTDRLELGKATADADRGLQVEITALDGVERTLHRAVSRSDEVRRSGADDLELRVGS